MQFAVLMTVVFVTGMFCQFSTDKSQQKKLNCCLDLQGRKTLLIEIFLVRYYRYCVSCDCPIPLCLLFNVVSFIVELISSLSLY